MALDQDVDVFTHGLNDGLHAAQRLFQDWLVDGAVGGTEGIPLQTSEASGYCELRLG